MNSKRWQDHFEEAARAAEQVVSATPEANPLIAILEQKIISEDAYLTWAQEAFELPILKNSFFTDHAADASFWNKWQTHYSWQVDCFPVCEWDGTLFVACLEPKEFAPEMNVVCLLTSYECLQNRWSQYTSVAQPQAATATGAAAVADAQGFQLEDTSENVSTGEVPAAMDAPDGIVALGNSPSAAKEDSVSFDSIQLDSIPAAIPNEAPAASFDAAPAGLEGLLPTSESASENSSELSSETAPELASQPASQPATKASPKKVKVVKPAAVATILTKTAPNSNSVFFFENVLKKTPSAVDLGAIFEGMKAHFEKSILLAVDTTERAAKPIAWDAGFSAPEIVNEIVLTSPSIFRIANSTQRPYHGAITQNDVNDKFFAEWNSSQIPDHVTIVPVVIQEHVVGLLMGFAGAEAFNRTALQLVENLALELTSKLDVAAKQAA